MSRTDTDLSVLRSVVGMSFSPCCYLLMTTVSFVAALLACWVRDELNRLAEGEAFSELPASVSFPSPTVGHPANQLWRRLLRRLRPESPQSSDAKFLKSPKPASNPSFFDSTINAYCEDDEFATMAFGKLYTYEVRPPCVSCEKPGEFVLRLFRRTTPGARRFAPLRRPTTSSSTSSRSTPPSPPPST